MKFSPERDDAPVVTIQSVGNSGIDASAKAVVDAHGRIVGLLLEPQVLAPATRERCLPEKESSFNTELEATILWEENPSDLGPYRIAGFDISSEPVATGAPSGPRLGIL